ncbi:MAG TPA: undecaprenyldiphospho-muramoylpentapeptide beta-N-acetylglucosaminyltransferase [Acidimicrobiales bacterium]|nr:undecaprenyldiphospho-muramoylpentapeptide beta-N-acetylglucosaminyltransferase [Acidimicrobiales bacterium]
MSAAGTPAGARPWVVLAGGGTAGHVTPALAIAGALVEAGHDQRSVRFVGSRRGMERDLVPAAGFAVTLLPGRGIVRRLSRDNVGAALGLLAGTLEAVALVGRWRPAAVVSVGGYAAAPAAAAAVLWRVPLVLAEANAVPGAVNRLLGRFAVASAVSFPGTPLPRAVVTGNPIRERMRDVDRSAAGRRAARAALGYPDDVHLVVIAGGSLGAGRLNEAALALVDRWAARGDVALHHVVGARNAEALARRAPALPAGGVTYRQVSFEERMDLVYAAADVAVHRAGANTVAELAAAGVPSVLVPLPGSPGDHQGRNARAMAAAGAAVVVDDAALDGERLAAELDRLLGDPARLQRMAAGARTLAVPDAAARVAQLVEAHARERR